MEKKIKDYVEYQFRFDQDSSKEDKINEITSNLVDRYEALIGKGMEEEKAYQETMKHFGDFKKPEETQNAEVGVEKRYDWIDVFFLATIAFGAIGLILLFVNNIAAIVFECFSIGSFLAGISLRMNRTDKIKNKEFNIALYKANLRKLYRFIRPISIIWLVYLSIFFTRICAGFFLQLGFGISLLTLLQSSVSTNISVILLCIIFYSLFFFLFLVIFGFISRKIYQKLMENYYQETGSNEFNLKPLNISELSIKNIFVVISGVLLYLGNFVFVHFLSRIAYSTTEDKIVVTPDMQIVHETSVYETVVIKEAISFIYIVLGILLFTNIIIFIVSIYRKSVKLTKINSILQLIFSFLIFVLIHFIMGCSHLDIVEFYLSYNGYPYLFICLGVFILSLIGVIMLDKKYQKRKKA